ncbi:MAG: hypothetical protein HYX94_10205 [Chloroflexi bacterium]|nr:hypothetical protein [Chloroflexota bacterium]
MPPDDAALRIIDQLSHADALSVLRALAAGDEQIACRIAKMAGDRLSDVDWEEVADALHAELDALEAEEVWDQAGPKRHGYVDPTDAAFEMVEDVLEPYLDELRKYQKLGMSAEAMQLCRGILAGLYRFERESTSEFKDWAVDAPASFAAEVAKSWKLARPSQADVVALEEFIDRELGTWGKDLL